MASEKRLIDAEELWWKFESEPWYDNADRDGHTLNVGSVTIVASPG